MFFVLNTSTGKVEGCKTPYDVARYLMGRECSKHEIHYSGAPVDMPPGGLTWGVIERTLEDFLSQK